MKTICSLAFLSLLSVSALLAAEPPREASEILKDYDQLIMPALDPSKTKDQEYIRNYIDSRTKALEKQSALAKELYEAYPDNPRAVPLMATRLAQPPRGDLVKAIKEVEDFVNAHPKTEQSPNLLSMIAMYTRDKEKRLAIYRRILADYPNSQPAKSAQGQIRQVEDIGKPFDLSFTDAIADKPVSIKGLHGKVVVIDFWATWCGPCVAEMPKLKELYAQYKDKGVEFIGVSLDQPGEGLKLLKKFVEEKEIGWPQYFQGNNWQSDFSGSWGINLIPTVFIVDADGNLYSTEARGRLDTLIPELIKKRDG